MLQYLKTDLVSNLKEAKAVSVAVALIKEYGFNIIESNLPENCTRRYLVGINLPTPPNILRRFLTLKSNFPAEIEAKIYKAKENYHPKVYLIEKEDGSLIAFVGSANATKGGFTHNIEMSFAITDQGDCIKLTNWFNTLFNSAKQYDDVYIDKYETTYNRNRALASTQKSNVDAILNDRSPISGSNLIIQLEQFFRQSDFDAFSTPNHLLITPVVKDQRRAVRRRFLELHDRIIGRFPDYGLNDLHPAFQRNFYTSAISHNRGHNHIPKQALWLHYGKSPVDLSKYSKPYHTITSHARIQVILINNDREATIGIWLYIGKANFSYYDRKKILDNLNNPAFVNPLYDYILDLGGSSWLEFVGVDDIYVSDIKSPVDLINFLSQDDYDSEFIIGRNFDPNDVLLSEENIEETVLIEFSKLYKIYDLIKAPMPTT
jgi:HKD family nuclease